MIAAGITIRVGISLCVVALSTAATVFAQPSPRSPFALDGAALNPARDVHAPLFSPGPETDDAGPAEGPDPGGARDEVATGAA